VVSSAGKEEILLCESFMVGMVRRKHKVVTRRDLGGVETRSKRATPMKLLAGRLETRSALSITTQSWGVRSTAFFYTGITRGKRLVVLVGQKKAIAIAVRNVSGRRRWSKLDEWLRLGAPSRSSNSSKAD
jgi:hypothetical protein